MKGTKVRTCRIFSIQLIMAFLMHLPQIHWLIAIWGRRKMVFLRIPNFLWSDCLHWSILYFTQKRKFLFKNLMWPFLFLILTQCGKTCTPLTRGNFKSSKSVYGDPRDDSAMQWDCDGNLKLNFVIAYLRKTKCNFCLQYLLP